MANIVLSITSAQQITMGGVTFTVEGASAVGLDQTGRAYAVDGGSGITVTNITPDQTTVDGTIRSGVMLNPSTQVGTPVDPRQGIDARYTKTWDATLNVTGPISMFAGDKIIKGVSGPLFSTRTGDFLEFACLHCVTQAPTATQVLRPTMTWEDTVDNEPEVYDADIDAFAASFTPFDATSVQIPSYTSSLSWVDDYWAYPLAPHFTIDAGYENFSPPMADYGSDLDRNINSSFLFALSDAATVEQRKTIFRYLLMFGIEAGIPLMNRPEAISPFAGHYLGYQLASIFALSLLGRSAEIGTFMEKAGATWKQPYEITADRLPIFTTVHTDSRRPYLLRERTLPEQPGGSVVRLPVDADAFWAGNILSSTNDPRRGAGFGQGYRIIRASDNMEVSVTSFTSWPNAVGNFEVDVPIDQTSPFSAGEVVYLKEKYEATQIGSVWWANRGWADLSYNGLELGDSDYSGQAHYGLGLALLRWLDAVGTGYTFWDASLDISMKYTEVAMLDNYPWAGHDISGGNILLARDGTGGTDFYDQIYVPAGLLVTTAPDAFALADWSLTAGGVVTISAMPNCNGIASESVEYRLNGGAWTDSGLTTEFTTTFTIPAYSGQNVELRAVNRRGGGAASDIKTA